MQRALPRWLVCLGVVLFACSAFSPSKPRGARGTYSTLSAKNNTLRPSLLFIGIMSAPQNLQRRKEIRNTWLRHRLLRDQNIVGAKFIIGQQDGPDAWRQEADLRTEMDNRRDIVRLGVAEGYENLTHKTMKFFKWCSVHHSDSRFVMKIDDDTFPVIDDIVPLLQQRDAKYVYMGALMDGGPVQHEGKWAEDPNIFPDEFYPTYAAGSGYIFSLPLAAELTKAVAQREVRLLANEDTTVGVWVHDFADSHLEERVDFFGVPADVHGCTDGAALAMQLQDGEQACMWDKYLNHGQPGGGTCCRPLRCYGFYTPTEGDFAFWKTNPPERCPDGTTDPVPESQIEEVLQAVGQRVETEEAPRDGQGEEADEGEPVEVIRPPRESMKKKKRSTSR